MLNSDNGTSAAKLLMQSITRSRRWTDTDLDTQPPRDLLAGIGPHAGTYSDEEGLSVRLADNDGEIEVTVPGQPPIQLHFEDATTLSTDTLELRVRLGGDGSISIEQDGHLRRLVRTPPGSAGA